MTNDSTSTLVYKMSPKERAALAIDLLSSLILSNAGMLAREQHAPGPTPDRSDDLMAEHAHWVKELRDIRERLENLVTGCV